MGPRESLGWSERISPDQYRFTFGHVGGGLKHKFDGTCLQAEQEEDLIQR